MDVRGTSVVLPMTRDQPVECLELRDDDGVNVTMAQQWTGREARLLRQALRLSVRGFAEYLGVSARTISKWEVAGVDRCPRPEFQAILDTALSQASNEQRSGFAETVALTAHFAPPDALPPQTSRLIARSDPSALAECPWLPRMNVNQLRELSQTLDEARQQVEDEQVAYFERKLVECQTRDGDRGPLEALPSALSVQMRCEWLRLG